jgi:hypothetical protein
LLAFLVDGDNATASLIGEVLEEASKYGTLIIRRVYGDWTSPSLQSWRSILQEHALDPEQQFSNVAGKNATDSALIIDAMDILHRGIVRGFCIVSSDSDYTRLAKRIREEGYFVMGIGRGATPAAFRNACHVFVSIENLAPVPKKTPLPTPPQEATPVSPVLTEAPKRPAAEAIPILQKAFDAVVDEDGHAQLASLGNALLKLDPAFDPRSFGRSGLMTLLDALPEEFLLEKPKDGRPGVVFVRRQSAPG